MSNVSEKQKGTKLKVPQKMKAVVCHGPGEYRFETIDTPSLETGEILIKVEACGICAGDVKAWDGAPMFWGGDGQPQYIKTPVIPGHEFVGIVVEVGEGVTEYSLGDRLISEQIVPCNDCRFCKHGQYWMCEKHDIYGFQYNVNGGMAEYMKFPVNAINHKVPHDLPIEKAILIEPYACSMHAVNRANIQLGDFTVISGAGTLGLGMVTAAKLRGPGTLVVVDMRDDRLELAKQFGADIVLNPSKVDVAEEIKKMTDGYGCDVYIEASGAPASVIQGLHAIRKLGRFVEFSVFSSPVTVDWSIIGDRKELDILGAHLGPYCYPNVIQGIASGSLSTNGVVTHKLPLEEFEKGFEMVKKGTDSLKVILVP
ncbi:MDR/zinc-dependent alcohol dehydrogenase-like family protein [Priestia megaterium]|uniref:MDR/zinc-dependent alcohol dehydrogenase-like family protein n=1 Tax=Priestia megaterium TaxID=1404 RepID=UPI00234E64DC|nr:alcohol dehydrogenase catalytic domain-containing protein [Priestia megaterium]MDC7783181.1 alcohol dehydrogenase catalytic domain-containing protein [Priestia megaterium]